METVLFSYNTDVMPYSRGAQFQGIWAIQNKTISIFYGYVNAIALQRISWRSYLVYTAVMEIAALFDGEGSHTQVAGILVDENEIEHEK
ncbi:BQ2448_7683 [Microbotryum intermedium]|uniref:BQ2448_7683 protein n=1 Tax=Microbotryum intermedium TaxID=269621 RepID=A0A238FS22_9BASI|nr:BQ2448_7683 [Microbotryum intermedium]